MCCANTLFWPHFSTSSIYSLHYCSRSLATNFIKKPGSPSAPDFAGWTLDVKAFASYSLG